MVLFPAPSIWPSTLGLPRAPRAPLQPPRPRRVSDPFRAFFRGGGGPLVPTLGPRLSGSGIRGSPAAAETGVSEKGRRQRSGPRRLLRRPRGDSRPNLEVAHCAWAPAGPCPPEVRFPPRGGRTPRDWGLFLRCLAGDLPSAAHLSFRDPRERARGSRCWARRG